MATQKLKDSKYHNYLKAELAVLFTKQGIQTFVKDEMVQFHQKCLIDSNGQSLGTCYSCRTEHIVKCPTNGLCIQKKRKCSFHEQTYGAKNKKCPKGTCDKIYTEIIGAHQFRGPSFRNTDATLWCTNPWEVAKCFMSKDGYTYVRNIEETDFNGVINVCLNYTGIHSKFEKNDLLKQVREVGKALRHCPKLEVEDVHLHNYLRTLKTFLTEVAIFTTDNEATEAKEKIFQLEQNDLIVQTTDLQTVLNEAKMDIKQLVENEIDELKKDIGKQTLKLIKVSMSAIKDQGEWSLSALQDALSEAIIRIKRVTKMAVDEIKEEKKKGILEIGDLITEGKDSIAKTIRIDKETSLESTFAEFKDQLVNFNKRQHNSVPLLPLFEEEDTPMEDFYVTPKLVRRNRKEEESIKSLQGVFYKKDKRCSEIYITAEAGFGKTAFCKRLVMAWCNAQTLKTEDHRCFSKEDISTMTDFDLLFLVSLRDAGDECDIDEMICKQILRYMDKPSTYTIQFLEEILSKKTCLVILDGLDEWMHKPNECTKKEKQIPHRSIRPNTTIATTTRPWKLSVSVIKSSEMGNTIEIKGLDKESVTQLTQNAIRKMNELSDATSNNVDIQVQAFDEAIENTPIKSFQEIPLLLLYMICLWKDGIELGRSMTKFYVRVIEFLLKRCKINSDSKHTPNDNVPLCFEEEQHELCRVHYQMLTEIGNLAFHTLFSKAREGTLVFDQKEADKYLKKENLETSLKCGILTRSKIQNMSSSHSKISFAHKSIHEFFAALCIYNIPDNVLKFVKPVCKNINSIVQMKLVYTFFSGINTKISEEISQMIMEVVAKDQRTQSYREYSLIWDRSITQALLDLQNMSVDILNELYDSDRETGVSYLQDIFIGYEREPEKYKKSLQKLLFANKNNIKTISIKSNESDDVYEAFNLSEIKGLEKIFYRKDTIGEEVDNLLKRSKETLRYLTLNCHKWESDIKCEWSPTLADQIRLLKHLEGIAIEGFAFQHKSLQYLFDYIMDEKRLLEVSLYNIKCVDHKNGECCALDLSAHDNLKVLRLNCIPLSDININVTSLETCEVGYLGLSVIAKYLQQLESAEKLTTFLCSFLESEIDIKCVLERLPALQHLRWIQLRKFDIGENQLQLSHEIEKITLWQIKISVKSLRKLKMDMEKKFKKSIHVEIKDCTILQGQKEFEKFKDEVRDSSSLTVERLDPKSFVFATK